MKVSFVFIRGIFVAFSALVGAVVASHLKASEESFIEEALGLSVGVGFSLGMIALEKGLKKVSIRSLTTLTLGLFLGVFFAQGVLFFWHSLLKLFLSQPTFPYGEAVHAAVYLGAVYCALIVVARGADQLHLAIPFVKLQETRQSKKDFILDSSVLCDTRFIDLAASGLVDNLLIIPRFVVDNLHAQYEKGSVAEQLKTKKCLDIVKNLQRMPSLGLRFHEEGFVEGKSEWENVVQLAYSLNAGVLTADMSELQQGLLQEVPIVRFQKLCQALKPLAHSGEQLTIKIQRYGKEPRQGVGYLEDGTMVVVNGGAEFIGETIMAQVLSVKHSHAGRIIFCNAIEEPFLRAHKQETSYEHSTASIY
jgi:uncharacterized protein YacL